MYAVKKKIRAWSGLDESLSASYYLCASAEIFSFFYVSCRWRELKLFDLPVGVTFIYLFGKNSIWQRLWPFGLRFEWVNCVFCEWHFVCLSVCAATWGVRGGVYKVTICWVRRLSLPIGQGLFAISFYFLFFSS